MPGTCSRAARAAAGVEPSRASNRVGPPAHPQDGLGPASFDTERVEVRIAQLGEAGGVRADAEPRRAGRLLAVAPGQGPERLPGLEAGDLLLQDRRDQDLHQRAGGGQATPRAPTHDLGDRLVMGDEVLRWSSAPTRPGTRSSTASAPGPQASATTSVTGPARVGEDPQGGRAVGGAGRPPEAVAGEAGGGVVGATADAAQGPTEVDRRDREGSPGGRRVSADGSSPDGSSPCRPNRPADRLRRSFGNDHRGHDVAHRDGSGPPRCPRSRGRTGCRAAGGCCGSRRCR